MAAPEEMEETVLIRAVMDFLKLPLGDDAGMPASLDALVDRIAVVADLGALPASLGPELGGLTDFVARLREVTLRNLNLARRYRPGHVDTDALFLRAAWRGGRGADAMIHDTPEVWRSHVGGDSGGSRHRLQLTRTCCCPSMRLASAPKSPGRLNGLRSRPELVERAS